MHSAPMGGTMLSAVTRQPVNLRVILVIIGSGIIVFVPLYKKYRKKSKKQ